MNFVLTTEGERGREYMTYGYLKSDINLFTRHEVSSNKYIILYYIIYKYKSVSKAQIVGRVISLAVTYI